MMTSQIARVLGVVLWVLASACGGDDTSAAGAGGSGGGGAGSGGSNSGDAEFEACLETLQPLCVASEQSTAELLEVPCQDMEMLPIPLSDGGTYGPMVLKGGPYGGQLHWNQGAGTEFVNPVNVAEPICVPTGIETFMEPASVNAEILNLRDVDYSLYTIFRPACFKEGETYPVITWANGTCGEMAGYAPLLGNIASHGFVVISSNSTWTATAPTNGVQARALDYAEALNADPESPLYQRLDLTRVGAMGHSQGASATGNVDGDPRVKSVIFWNTGTSNEKPFLNVSGERDVMAVTPASMAASVDAATQPGAWLYYHQILETGGSSTGHLVLMMQPERVVDMAVAWWKWQLNGDADAKTMFVGDDCGLCSSPDAYEFGHNALMN